MATRRDWRDDGDDRRDYGSHRGGDGKHLYRRKSWLHEFAQLSPGWALVDPLLAWAASVVGLATDLGFGLARWFGIGREATALRDTANFDGLIGWAAGPGPVHVLAKASLLLVWLAGVAALAAAPALLRRLGSGAPPSVRRTAGAGRR